MSAFCNNGYRQRTATLVHGVLTVPIKKNGYVCAIMTPHKV